jgi:hypothetical protein
MRLGRTAFATSVPRLHELKRDMKTTEPGKVRRLMSGSYQTASPINSYTMSCLDSLRLMFRDGRVAPGDVDSGDFAFAP